MVDERRSKKNGGLGRKRPREGKAKDSGRGGGGSRNRKGRGVVGLPDHPHKVCAFSCMGFCVRVCVCCVCFVCVLCVHGVVLFSDRMLLA